MIKQNLTDAARKACRTAILPGKTYSDVTAEITDILTDMFGATAAANAPAPVISVNGTAASSGTDLVASSKRGDEISVKVSVKNADTNWITGNFFLQSTSTESNSMIMMRQGP